MFLIHAVELPVVLGGSSGLLAIRQERSAAIRLSSTPVRSLTKPVTGQSIHRWGRDERGGLTQRVLPPTPQCSTKTGHSGNGRDGVELIRQTATGLRSNAVQTTLLANQLSELAGRLDTVASFLESDQNRDPNHDPSHEDDDDVTDVTKRQDE
jgi:hypothetical protein